MAQIDFVRTKTGHAKIPYIGHSQGTSQMFSALSLGQGGLKDKLTIFIAICPITNIYYAQPPIGGLSKALYNTLVGLVNINGIYEILGPNWIKVQN